MTAFADLLAADVMHTPVVCAEPDETFAEVRARFVENHISGMPVIEGGRLTGVISRSDFVRVPALLEALAGHIAGRPEDAPVTSDGPPQFAVPLDRILVRDVMPRSVITCAPDTPVQKVADEMLAHHVHRVIVVDGERPVGVISSLDLVRLLSDAAQRD